MAFLFAFIAFLCGVALVFEFDTGSLEPLQVAGIGLICAALAIFAGPGWPTWLRRE